MTTGPTTDPRAAAVSSGGFDTQLVAGAWRLFLRGVWLTATLAATSLALGLPIGLALALARVPPRGWLAVPAATYVEVMRGTPLLVQILFIYFVLPGIGVRLPALASGVIALTLNAAAYISEVFRAGILSIDGGQMEAARALGLSHWQAIALLKDSSLVSVIGLTELARTGQGLASRHAAPLTIWPVVALLYLVLTFPLTRVAERLERRWRPVARG